MASGTSGQGAPSARVASDAPQAAKTARKPNTQPAPANATESAETLREADPSTLAALALQRLATHAAQQPALLGAASAGKLAGSQDGAPLPSQTLGPVELAAPGDATPIASTSEEPEATLAEATNTASASAGAPADVRDFATALESSAPRAAAAPRENPSAQETTRAAPAHTPAPGEAERAADILRQMRVHFAPQMRSATIQLTPAELGRISIRLHLQDGELRAVVRAEKRETLDALARHVPELRATLEQQGIQARQFELQLGFQQQDTRQPGEQPAAPNSNGSHEPQSASRPEEARLARALAVRVGGIDTYA